MIGQKVFAKSVAERIKDYLPLENDDVKFAITEKRTNNGGIKVCICFKKEGRDITPLISVEPFYEDIRNGKPLDEVMQNIASYVQQEMGRDIPNNSQVFLDYDNMKDHIGLRLVNTKVNQKMLDALPHQKIEDLSLIPVIRFLSTEGNYVAKITNQLMETWGVSADTLFEKAKENAERVQSPVLQGFESIICERFTGEKTNLLATGIREGHQEEIMYVLSNKDGIDGASSMACPSVMEKINGIFPGGFYILPSSIHEVIIIPKEDKSPVELGRIVREVNVNLNKEEFLSDRVYEYNKEKGKIQQIPESIDRNKEWER